MAKRKAAKRKPLKKVPKRKAILPMDHLRGILASQSTDDLVQIIVELADSNPRALRQVQQRFKVEGLMTDDIQECLLPVIKAVRKSGLKSADVFHWSNLMLATDRVGFICREEVLALQASVLK